jgi:tetratricopeptide (TPR) repeat protein
MDAQHIEHKHQGQLVARYREAAHLSQGKLAEYMRVSVHTVQRMEKEPVIKDLNRRRLLVALLGIPAADLGLDEKRQQIEESTLLFNEDPMSFIEDLVASRWQIYLLGGPVSAARGLDSVVKVVANFAQEAQGKEWHQRAYAQLCLTYYLQAGILSDTLHHQEALQKCQQALMVAKELEDIELQAAVQVWQGVIFMRQNNPLKAVQYLDSALNLINGQGFPLLRGNTLAVLSEAHARAHQPQECWRAIGLAERVLEQRIVHRERSYRDFNAAWVTAHKGSDALLLHDYERALRLLDKSLKDYNPTLIPQRVRYMARKAEAYYGLNRIDECTFIAEEAWMLARAVGTGSTISRLRALQTTLGRSRWRREPSVLRLGVLLSTGE